MFCFDRYKNSPPSTKKTDISDKLLIFIICKNKYFASLIKALSLIALQEIGSFMAIYS